MPVRLFVGNLSYDASEAELRQHFGTIGPVSYCYLPTDRETGRPRGFAFVEYADDALAQEAITRLNNQPFRGRPLAVKEAQPRVPGGAPGPRPPMGGGGMGAPRFGGPPRPMGGGPPGSDGGFRSRPTGTGNFGPDAPPKGKKGKFKPSEPRGPKGPIRVKPDGRIYSTEDLDEGEDAFEGDNFATSAADEPEGGSLATAADELEDDKVEE
jgi:RNA recognition motif-containing protein